MMRLLLLVAVAVAFYLLLRRLARPQEVTPQPPHTVLDGDAILDQEDDAPSSPLQIRDYGFREIDHVAGPPDGECFYDELLVHFYDPGSGREWRTTYLVATPLGIAKVMKEEKWFHLFANDLVIVERFDMPRILAALLERGQERFDILPQETDEKGAI